MAANASVEVPAAVIDLLLGHGLQTVPGQAVLTTILSLHPELRDAVRAHGGNLNITAGPGRLAAGRAEEPPLKEPS